MFIRFNACVFYLSLPIMMVFYGIFGEYFTFCLTSLFIRKSFHKEIVGKSFGHWAPVQTPNLHFLLLKFIQNKTSNMRGT